MSLKDQALNARDASVERCPIPEWEPDGGQPFYIRSMSGKHRDELEVILDQPSTSPLRRNIRAKVAAWSLCDADGNLVFAESDVAALGERSAVVLDRLLLAAQRKSALTLPAIEEVGKNLGAALSGDSGLSSPGI